MSVFRHVEEIPPDPIFGLAAKFKEDPRKVKVDLSVGIYRDKQLICPILHSVKEAEKKLIQIEETKAYLPMRGDIEFIDASGRLVFGNQSYAHHQTTLFGEQTVGATAALFIGAAFLKENGYSHIYVPTPTWPNHTPIFKRAGLQVSQYPYYDRKKNQLLFEDMTEFFLQLEEKSIVLLHVICHNPSGCDLTREQWHILAEIIRKKKLFPFFDFAYQGFGKSSEEDAYPVRYFLKEGYEMLIANSFSKSFSLYSERIGTLFVHSKENVKAVGSWLKQISRCIYSNPARHGSAVVKTILNDAYLRTLWEKDLENMRTRLHRMRTIFAEALYQKTNKEDYLIMKQRNGFFSFCPLQEKEVAKLQDEYGIYITKTGRVNISGLNDQNMSYVVDAITKVTNSL